MKDKEFLPNKSRFDPFFDSVWYAIVLFLGLVASGIAFYFEFNV